MKLVPVKGHPLAAYIFWCPGCDEEHIVYTKGPDGHLIEKTGDAPTIKGVIKSASRGGTDGNGSMVYDTCELHIENGVLCYTDSCTHHLKKQFVEMVDMDDRYVHLYKPTSMGKSSFLEENNQQQLPLGDAPDEPECL